VKKNEPRLDGCTAQAWLIKKNTCFFSTKSEEPHYNLQRTRIIPHTSGVPPPQYLAPCYGFLVLLKSFLLNSPCVSLVVLKELGQKVKF